VARIATRNPFSVGCVISVSSGKARAATAIVRARGKPR
jgi:hypothetical protein